MQASSNGTRMNLLTIDVGNTQTVLGVFRDSSLEGHWRIATSNYRTADELGVLLVRLLELHGFPANSIDGAIMASVVPPVTPIIERAVAVYLHTHPLVVEPGIKTGIKILYENPKEVGADRIVNAVAAYGHCGKSCMVVDFGTATTIDCVGDGGDYLGGVITPGPGISIEALVSRAAKLPKIELERPSRIIGQNTVESMQSGIFYGYLSMVDGLVRKIRQEMPDPGCPVLATGGLSRAFVEASEEIDEVLPYLTLHGLYMLYERNLSPEQEKQVS